MVNGMDLCIQDIGTTGVKMETDKFMNQKAKDMTLDELASAIRIRIKETREMTQAKYKALIKPKPTWKDVTRECEFKIDTDWAQYYYLRIFHNGKEIGSSNSWRPDNKETNISLDGYNYKQKNKQQHFKILKKVE